jgi:hypothetical protein
MNVLEAFVKEMTITRGGYGQCEEWPNCVCRTLHQAYEIMLERWNDPNQPSPTMAEIERHAPVIWAMVMCLNQHCPDLKLQGEAMVQLYDGVWWQLGLPRRRTVPQLQAERWRA